MKKNKLNKAFRCSTDDPGYLSTSSDSLGYFTNRQLILPQLSLHLASCQQLIIHSCSRLILTNDTFKGFSIHDRFQIIGIPYVEFRAHAFRGIQRSPQSLIIQDSHVERVGIFAFVGLSGIEHFWWKNSTIKRIAKMAFTKLRKVQYLYFRGVHIEMLEPGAFGNRAENLDLNRKLFLAHMHQIQHFYMRNQIQIAQASDHLFVGSTFDEVIFEEASIDGTDLSFVGLQSRRVHFLNSRLHLRKSVLRRVPQQKIDHFYSQNTTFNRVALPLFYNISRYSKEKIILVFQHLVLRLKKSFFQNSIRLLLPFAYSCGAELLNF